MAVKNQYSDLVPAVWFDEYKVATPERQQEIEAEVFRILRSVNTFPQNEYNLTNEINSLRALCTLHTKDVYDKKKQEIGINNNGLDVLYRFYPNIWKVKKNDCPITVFDGFFLDDKLKRAIKKTLTYSDSMLDLVKWLRMIGLGYVVNFRPSAAKTIYEVYGPEKDCKVYDYAAGYGGRMLGAWAAKNVTEYVAVDVNTETVANAQKLIQFLDTYYPNLQRTEVHLNGSEDFNAERFPQYQNYFDIAFASPQYFDTEIYSDEPTQSCHKFPQYDLWVKNFLRPTLHNAIHALKREGVLGINIFEKLPNMKKIIVFICEELGFQLFEETKMLLRTMPGSAGIDKETGESISRDTSIGTNYEPIWVFMNKDVLKERGIKGYGVRDFHEISVDKDVRKRSVKLSTGKSIKGDTHYTLYKGYMPLFFILMLFLLDNWNIIIV